MNNYSLYNGERFAVATDRSGVDHLVKVQERTGLSGLWGRWKITTPHEYGVNDIDVSLSKILKCIEGFDWGEHVHVMAEIKEEYGAQEVTPFNDDWNVHIDQIEAALLEGVEETPTDSKEKLFAALNKADSFFRVALVKAAQDQLSNEDLTKIIKKYGRFNKLDLSKILKKRNVKKVKEAAEKGDADESIKLLKQVVEERGYFPSDFAGSAQEPAKDIVDHFKGDIGLFYNKLAELDLDKRLETVSFIKEKCSKEKVYQNKEAWSRLVGQIEKELVPSVSLPTDPIKRALAVIEALKGSSGDRLDYYVKIIQDTLPNNEIMKLFDQFNSIRDLLFEERVIDAIRNNDIEFIAKYLEVTEPVLRHFPNGFQGAAEKFISISTGFFARLTRVDVKRDYFNIISSLVLDFEYNRLLQLWNETSRVDRKRIQEIASKVSQYKECPQLNDSSVKWPTAINDSRKKGSGTISLSKENEKASENWDKCETIARQKAIEHRGMGKVNFIELLNEFHRTLGDGLRNNGGQPGEFRKSLMMNAKGDRYLSLPHLHQALKDMNLWLNNMCEKCDEEKMSPIEFAALAYQRLVSIHPYEDANGRTSRMLMDYILMRYHIPPACLGGVRNFAIFFSEHAQSKSPEEAVEQVVSGLNTTIELLEREATDES